MSKLELIGAKIIERDKLIRTCAMWRFKGRKIVFTNGCFDILHLGHIEYLTKAADLGHELVIGLNSDTSVRKLKGHTRPINDEKSRAMVMASLSFVSAVVIFDEDTPYELISQVKPDFLVKGDDYSKEEIAGWDFVESNGGQVVTIALTPGYSTSSIEQKIIHLQK